MSENVVGLATASNLSPVETPTAVSKFADPGPLAVGAFSATSFMLGVYNAGLLHSGGVAVVFPAAFFFGGMIQLLVSVLEFIRGNTFGTMVFGTYGAFWVIFGGIEIWFAKMMTPSDIGSAVSLFLAMFAILTFFFFIASLKTDRVLISIFFLLLVTFILLSIGAGSGLSGFTTFGGWTTILFSILGFYHAGADLINSTYGRAVLSNGPVKK
ncbi:acetate uptake transporter [Ferroacidibacillus organovorans]|uniref:Uncharacterized protein n=1 Tax=Ferroacidibacillus organovorans TaxID=1765683 RepID=A0A101XQ60_9BACL|nr:GPR1/FUN34/YaaH family transporter [Ferroacidibacillus organovorans]KUO95533.1 hypothetical protein ATW55_06495 [Ferroacidibacillus organovorans]